MANLNLSQFTEKLFVADADHTFIWDTAGAISKRVSRNSWLNSGTLTSDAPVTISQTWNNAAVAFTGLKVNAAGTSDANSASGSLLADFQVNGTTKANITKSGSFVGGSSGASKPSALSFPNSGSYSVGIYNPESYKIQFSMTSAGPGGIAAGAYTGLQYEMTAGVLSWGTTAQDIVLARDSQNTLALRNGAGVPQTFRVYNTFLGTTANEWFEIDWKTSAGTVRHFTMHGGTGVARNIDISAGGTLYFGAGTSSPIRMYSNGVERWNISTAGHFIAATDNSVDIGASGASRPRNVYVGTNVISRPAASITPANNGEFVVEATSNTTLTFKLKGTDGTVRSGTITLA